MGQGKSKVPPQVCLSSPFSFFFLFHISQYFSFLFFPIFQNKTVSFAVEEDIGSNFFDIEDKEIKDIPLPSNEISNDVLHSKSVALSGRPTHPEFWDSQCPSAKTWASREETVSKMTVAEMNDFLLRENIHFVDEKDEDHLRSLILNSSLPLPSSPSSPLYDCMKCARAQPADMLYILERCSHYFCVQCLFAHVRDHLILFRKEKEERRQKREREKAEGGGEKKEEGKRRERYYDLCCPLDGKCGMSISSFDLRVGLEAFSRDSYEEMGLVWLRSFAISIFFT